MNTEERIDLFKRELSYIKDDVIRGFAEKLLADADDYFFTMPASTSGKYHPEFAKGDGGLVRHTKAVAYFANELVRAELTAGSITQHTGDLIVASAIAHDIKKMGDGTSGHTVKDHPIYASQYIAAEHASYVTISNDDICFMRRLVERHMGPWMNPKPETLEERILFYADYVASRDQIVGLKFIEANDNTTVSQADVIPATDIPAVPAMTVKDYVFDFGKTRGCTIDEAYKKEPGYIKWMANKDGFNNQEVQNLVRQYLKENNVQ